MAMRPFIGPINPLFLSLAPRRLSDCSVTQETPMATGNAYSPRPAYRFLSTDQISPSPHHDSSFELDESVIYGAPRSASPDFPRAAASRPSKIASKLGDRDPDGRAAPSSLPVNVPDWSKTLMGEYRDSRRRDSFDDDNFEGGGGAGEGMRMPPHEFLARTRMASLSVHEGRGRTLKGRDLSRVRNAIWEKTGFED